MLDIYPIYPNDLHVKDLDYQGQLDTPAFMMEGSQSFLVNNDFQTCGEAVSETVYPFAANPTFDMGLHFLNNITDFHPATSVDGQSQFGSLRPGFSYNSIISRPSTIASTNGGSPPPLIDSLHEETVYGYDNITSRLMPGLPHVQGASSEEEEALLADFAAQSAAVASSYLLVPDGSEPGLITDVGTTPDYSVSGQSSYFHPGAMHQYNNYVHEADTRLSPTLSSQPCTPSDEDGPGFNSIQNMISGDRDASPSLPKLAQPSLKRKNSTSSIESPTSGSSNNLSHEDNRETQRCPYPECQRLVKDLKAHLFTHSEERPEKCPIPSCPYHIKGFARKYDCARHTLTHFKGNMICNFCPDSGTSKEKSFNRADVFKRHLTQLHNVEQTTASGKKKSTPGSTKGKATIASGTLTGKCSMCSKFFSNAQEFYDHLDDCVLKLLENPMPSEKINQTQLSAMDSDPSVQAAIDRLVPYKIEDGADQYAEDDKDESDYDTDTSATKRARKAKKVSKYDGPNPRGMTRSKEGIKLTLKEKRRKRKYYPTSWNTAKDEMKMKRRVLCVFDGPRRLWKDDMMLSSEWEQRMMLPTAEGNAYVTDLDMFTLDRANALLDATGAEKGPDDPFADVSQFYQLMNN